MAHSWSQAVATDGNPWQRAREEKRLKQAKTVAIGCDQLPIGAHRRDAATLRGRVCRCASGTHREALRNAAITYLDDCFSTIADGEPGQSHADTPIGSYLPSRYE